MTDEKLASTKEPHTGEFAENEDVLGVPAFQTGVIVLACLGALFIATAYENFIGGSNQQEHAARISKAIAAGEVTFSMSLNGEPITKEELLARKSYNAPELKMSYTFTHISDSNGHPAQCSYLTNWKAAQQLAMLIEKNKSASLTSTAEDKKSQVIAICRDLKNLSTGVRFTHSMSPDAFDHHFSGMAAKAPSPKIAFHSPQGVIARPETSVSRSV